MFAFGNPSVDGFLSGEHGRVYNLLATTTISFHPFAHLPPPPYPFFLYTRFPMSPNSDGNPDPDAPAEASEWVQGSPPTRRYSYCKNLITVVLSVCSS